MSKRNIRADLMALRELNGAVDAVTCTAVTDNWCAPLGASGDQDTTAWERDAPSQSRRTSLHADVSGEMMDIFVAGFASQKVTKSIVTCRRCGR